MASTRPAQKPNAGRPWPPIAVLRARARRSPQERPNPSFSLRGCNRERAVSRFALSWRTKSGS
eukprot:8140923-Lingulodinium_polyedra.AAC.1